MHPCAIPLMTSWRNCTRVSFVVLSILDCVLARCAQGCSGVATPPFMGGNRLMAKALRIGSGLGFYGDSWEPVVASIERGGVQYIASDHLAELTLAILQKDRQRDASLGFARDVVPMLVRLWPLMRERGVKFVCNAGGLNPLGAAAALRGAFASKGWNAKIAVVQGDDVLTLMDVAKATPGEFTHLFDGSDVATVRDRLVFANAYLGARPIVDALTQAPGTGGVVNFDTVRQQLLYEVHDPHAYLSPDVVLDMSTLTLTDLGDDRVRVAGATGRMRPDRLKVVAGFHDGHKAEVTWGFSWPDAMAKAQAAVAMVKTQLAERGVPHDELFVEYPGLNSAHGPLAPTSPNEDELNEVWVRMVLRTASKSAADGFGRLFPWMGLSGPAY